MKKPLAKTERSLERVEKLVGCSSRLFFTMNTILSRIMSRNSRRHSAEEKEIFGYDTAARLVGVLDQHSYSRLAPLDVSSD